MDYQLIIRSEAKEDLLDAFHWYQEQRSDFGFDFKLCVGEVINKIKKSPHISNCVSKCKAFCYQTFSIWNLLYR